LQSVLDNDFDLWSGLCLAMLESGVMAAGLEKQVELPAFTQYATPDGSTFPDLVICIWFALGAGRQIMIPQQTLPLKK
jgi:hypothetical protein